jgi:hypothetical protein
MSEAEVIFHLGGDEARALMDAVAQAQRQRACANHANLANDACLLKEYQQRVCNLFVRVCPDRPFTGTFIDIDTMQAIIESRLPRVGSAQIRSLRDIGMRWFQAYGDPRGGSNTRWHATRDYRPDDALYDSLADMPWFQEAARRNREDRDQEREGGK